MCTTCYPDDIAVCPSCKRDDEAYKLGESDSPFDYLGDGKFRCICGKVFSFVKTDKEVKHNANV
jgi:hypothetical protein